MSNTLPVSNIANISVDLSPAAAQGANLNTLMILGASDVINVSERARTYTGTTIASDVETDFGSSAPEYLAALNYMSQVPQPSSLMIGRWAKTATSGLLLGGDLTSAEQTISNWTAITNGGVDITIDGSANNLTTLDFSGESTLNGVASVITTALAGAGTVTWDGSKFIVTSATTGATSTVGYATVGAGTDISSMLKLDSTNASAPIDGIASELVTDAVNIMLQNFATQFLGLMVADTSLVNTDHTAIATIIEADQAHIYGATTQETGAIDATSTTDLAYLLNAGNYQYSFCQYSSTSPYAVASMFGRFLTTNFNANNSTITLMFKQEPGITAESLTTTQAAALAAKNGNVFVNYSNSTAIIQYGTMAKTGIYIDSIYGLIWLKNRLQTDGYNELYTSTTKVPQTDEGMHQLATVLEGGCIAGVNNGLIAPGTWTAGGFGTLEQGDFLHKGYYIYTPLISSQSTADRAARKSVPFQIAVKLGGAVHELDATVNVNQ